MAHISKGILGQSAPSATTLTDMYTVPQGKHATGRVIVTNRALGAATFRIAIAVEGAADSNEQYVAWDKALAGNETGSTIAFFMNKLDVLRVFASSSDLSFTFTGLLSEIEE